MLSEIILGTVVPFIMCIQSRYIKQLITITTTSISYTYTLYKQLFETVNTEYKDIPYRWTFVPFITSYRFIIEGISLLISYYIYTNTTNDSSYLTHINGGVCISYTRNGEQYLILLPIKDKSHELTLLEAYGIREEIVFTESQSDDHSESQSESQSDDHSEDHSDDQLESEEKEDISELMNAIMGPDRDFHSQSITPKLLGYNQIILRYVDGELNEHEVSFSSSDIICLLN